ncbi:HAD-IIB family hydrolase [Sulfitobacter sp.]|uniref:HAD-IIB family hydrolase n=1 Tax=Sulfitobacter sp. TaxID=1903071 RepID=UPI003001B63A
MTAPTPLVVFSDLDGILLDHSDYSWSAAQPALDVLAQLGAPVVLASSKTASEIAVLQQAMGLGGLPAIVENGVGIIGLHAEAVCERYSALRERLDQVPEALRKCFEGFGDMDVARVMSLTRLSEQDAVRARKRAFSEPGVWHGTDADEAAFIDALADLGIAARRGGRFLTLSFGGTKADRMAEIIAHFKPLHSIALGDAPNDIEMLEAADYGVIVANPHHDPLPPLGAERTGRIIRTSKSGPDGWNEAVLKLVEQLNLTVGRM